jgi:hypothetical protein
MMHQGDKYNRLTAIEFEYRNKSSKQYWKFQCDCTNYKTCREDAVVSGNIKSCGCLPKENCAKVCRKYIQKHTEDTRRLYRILQGMKRRCYDTNYKQYCNYGGKGITICEEWLNNSDSFVEWALANGYKPSLTIDKINNDKGYSPDNCQWMTLSDNSSKKGK